jgi:rhomboid protease GluP
LERAKRLFGGPPELWEAKVTLGLIAVNAIVFVAEVLYARSPGALMGMTEHAMLVFGANYTPFVIGEHRVELLLTSCFLHFSIIHVAFNLYALRQVGPFVERTVGSARFFPMFLLSGVIGSGASCVWGWLTHPERLSAGASGAICGVIGTALVLGARLQGWNGPIVKQMGFWLGLTILLGMGIGADNAAHIGGAITGAVFAAAWRRGIVYTNARQKVTMGVCIALVVLAGATVAARNVLDPWATLDADSRIALAMDALERGSCADAILATDRADRIAPRSPRVHALKREIVANCR